MKILHISLDAVNRCMGGLGVHVRELASAQSALGHDVSVLGMDPTVGEYYEGQFRGFKLINCRNTSTQIALFGLRALVSVHDVMMENFCFHFGREKFDVVHCHDSKFFYPAKNMSLINRSRMVLTSHLSFLLSASSPDVNDPCFKFESQQEIDAHALCHSVITVSQAYKQRLIGSGIGSDEIDVIPNGINMSEFEGIKPDYEEVASIAGKRRTVGFVGRCTSSKLSLLLDVIEMRPPNTQFILISFQAPDVNVSDVVVDRIKRAQEAFGNCYWIKDLPSESSRKWEIVKACDMAVVSSTHEPYGIVADELGALQVPRIVTKVDGLPEHCSDDDSIMIEPTAKALYDAIDNFKRDEKKVKAAFGRVCEMSWSKVAMKTGESYVWPEN